MGVSYIQHMIVYPVAESVQIVNEHVSSLFVCLAQNILGELCQPVDGLAACVARPQGGPVTNMGWL